MRSDLKETQEDPFFKAESYLNPSDPKDSDFIVRLAKLVRPGLNEDQINTLEELDIMIEGYPGTDRLLLSIPKEHETALSGCSFIEFLEPFGIENRVDKVLQKKLENARSDGNKNMLSERIDVNMILFARYNNEKHLTGILSVFKDLGIQPVALSGNQVRLNLELSDVEELAVLDFIRWIEVEPEYHLCNDISASIIDADRFRPDLGLNGSGQIVGVFDSGLDSGIDNESMHDDFEGKIHRIRNYYGTAADDNSGHGTHVAGTFVGTGSKSGGQYRGIADGAELIFQAGGDDAGTDAIYPPMNLKTVFQYAYNNGARVHSNSWGADLNGAYNTRSQDADDFIWDNDNFTIIVSAGNEGPISTTINAPGTAKNVITVGASENLRPSKGISGDNIDHLYSFTSLGPTIDGRIKPDVVAPGTWILSTRANKDLVAENASAFWEEYNDYYAYAGGTSMATPAVAGAATLIRQYFMEKHDHEPSAALIKASLINGAEDIGTPDIPNYSEGWGRVNISNSLCHKTGTSYRYIDSGNGLITGQNYTVQYDIIDSADPLKVTLVWSDYMGDPGFDGELINDLDLVVENNQSGIYYGNNFQDGWSSNGTKIDIDNNLECVYIKNPPIGRYNITIRGKAINQGPQKFALFSTGNLLEHAILPPRGLKIIPDIAGSALNLTWWPNLAPNITIYNVYRSNFTPDDFQFVVQVPQSSNPYFHDTDLENKLPYFYKLKAITSDLQESIFSDVAVGVPGDFQAPNLIITHPVKNSKLRSNVSLEYNADDDTYSVRFQYYIDKNGDGYTNDNNSWIEIGVDLTPRDPFYWDTTSAGSGPGDADYVILGALAKDAHGNNYTTYITGLKIDNTAPEPPVIYPIYPNPRKDPVVYIRGSAEIGSNVSIYNNGIFTAANITNSSGTFNILITLNEGINNITADSKDELGNGPGPISNALLVILDETNPTVITGGPYIVNIGMPFTLDAGASYDDTGNDEHHYIVNYTWIISKDFLTYYFGELANLVLYEFGSYSVTLQLRDLAGNTASGSTTLTVTDTIAPIADAGGNLTVNEDQVILISGGNSYDNDPSFLSNGVFRWVISSPSNSTFITLGMNLSHIFYDLGQYKVTLYVTDAHNNTGTDTIFVNVNDITPPRPASGGNRTAMEYHSITLNASMSSDNDPEFSTTGKFSWSFIDSGLEIILTGKTVTYTFTKLGTYKLTLSVSDKSGNTAIEIFYIEVVRDLSPPEIVTFHPMKFAVEVKLDTEISCTFSESIRILSITNQNFFIKDSSNQLISGSISYNALNYTVTFTPLSTLSSNEVYTVNVLDTIVDLAGNQLAQNYSWTFNTISPPLITEVTPPPSATGVKIIAKIYVLFNEPLKNDTIGSETIEVFDSNGRKLSGFVAYDDETFSISFQPFEKYNYYSEYQVILKDTISDLAGNYLEENFTWTFRTEKEVKPDEGPPDTLLLAVTLAILIIIILIAVLIGTGSLTFDKYSKKVEEDDVTDEESLPPPPLKAGKAVKPKRRKGHKTSDKLEELEELDEYDDNDEIEDFMVHPDDDAAHAIHFDDGIESEIRDGWDFDIGEKSLDAKPGVVEIETADDEFDVEWEADDDFTPPPPKPIKPTSYKSHIKKKKKKRGRV